MNSRWNIITYKTEAYAWNKIDDMDTGELFVKDRDQCVLYVLVFMENHSVRIALTSIQLHTNVYKP